MFSYKVMSEKEAMEARYQLLKEGIYDALIVSATEKTSSTGNPMLDMMVSVYDENGRSHEIRDFLVFTDKMTWKAIHCADSAGLSKEFEGGKFCSELIEGRPVKVKINIEQGGIIPEDKLKGSAFGARYPDKNKIEDYIKKDTLSESGNSANIDDDDVPF